MELRIFFSNNKNSNCYKKDNSSVRKMTKKNIIQKTNISILNKTKSRSNFPIIIHLICKYSKILTKESMVSSLKVNK